jgi:hypothetical protein
MCSYYRKNDTIKNSVFLNDERQVHQFCYIENFFLLLVPIIYFVFIKNSTSEWVLPLLFLQN